MTRVPDQTAQTQRLIGSAQATQPGPTLILIGGLHGNEPAGVTAAADVVGALASDTLRIGRVAAYRGNLMALASAGEPIGAGRRYLDIDLNRAFTPDRLASVRAAPDAERTAESRELLELSAAIEREVRSARGPVYLLDLHTFSSPGPAFIHTEDSLVQRDFARAIAVPLILGFEEELTGVMIHWASKELGVIGAIFEAGVHHDGATVAIHRAAIAITLDRLGVARADDISPDDPHAIVSAAAGGRDGHVYDIRHRHAVGEHRFEMHEGMVGFSPVRAGRTPIATEADRPVHSPVSGRLFMPNRQEEIRDGDDGFFVVHRVGSIWLTLSAKLRQSDRLHRLLPVLLPGVRAHPTRSAALIVSPEIALVLKRQMFHLLGYRLERRGPEVHLSSLSRLAAALVTAGQSTLHLLTGRWRRAEAESPGDWIVVRHVLDLSPRDRAKGS